MFYENFTKLCYERDISPTATLLCYERDISPTATL